MSSQWTDLEEDAVSYKVLDAQQARQLLAKQSPFPLGRVVFLQLLAGFFVVLFAVLFSSQEGAVFSAVAGVAAAWFPSAIVALWMAWRQRNKLPPIAFLAELYFFELLKIVVTIALLLIVFLWMKPLVWPFLLAGFVVTVKAYGVVCWLLLGKHRN